MQWYKYDVRQLTEEEYNRTYALLSEDARCRVDRMPTSETKKRTVAGEMLARTAIAAWCGVAEEDVSFAIGAHGKPYAPDLPVEFNVSHSGDWVVCAVDDRPVGIDVERIRPIDLKVAKRMFTEEELCYVFGHAPTAQDFAPCDDAAVLTRFFTCWTTREAYGKYRGIGLTTAAISPDCGRRTIIEDGYVVTIVGDGVTDQ